MRSIHLLCFELIRSKRKVPEARLLLVWFIIYQKFVYICFAFYSAPAWLTYPSLRCFHFAGARQSSLQSLTELMRVAKETDSDVDVLSATSQSWASPVMLGEKVNRNVISQSFSPLYQCSSWTSKSTERGHMSILLWPPSWIGIVADASK